MATAQLPHPPLKWAKAPFYFNSAAHLLRIGRERCTTLAELLDAIRSCPEASIFQHTFQTLHEHHFIREGFSNDFAQWAFAACNEVGLAERLASVDVREFTSIEALRQHLIKIISEYLADNPRARDRAAFEPFYFCSSEVVVIPTTLVARNLEEFAAGMRTISVHGISYHFIDARLRLHLKSNDFSVWLDEELGERQLAAALERVDIYTSTLEGVRNSILQVLQQSLSKTTRERV